MLGSVKNFVNFVGELVVFIRYSVASVMSLEFKPDPVVGVDESGVVVVFFCQQGNFGHKGKSLRKIFEPDVKHQSVFIFYPHRLIFLQNYGFCSKTQSLRTLPQRPAQNLLAWISFEPPR
jgi:hypothetical protein